MAISKTAVVLPNPPQDSVLPNAPSQLQQKQSWKRNPAGGSTLPVPPLDLSRAEAIQNYRLSKEVRSCNPGATVPLFSGQSLLNAGGNMKVADHPGQRRQEAPPPGVPIQNNDREERVSASTAGVQKSEFEPVCWPPAGNMGGAYIVSGNAADLHGATHIWPSSASSSTLLQTHLMPGGTKGMYVSGNTGPALVLSVEGEKVSHYPLLPGQYSGSLTTSQTKGTMEISPGSAGVVPQQAVMTYSLARSSPGSPDTYTKLHGKAGNLSVRPEDLNLLAVDTARTQRFADSSQCCAGSPCVAWFAAGTSPAQKKAAEAHRSKAQERDILSQERKQGGRADEGIISRLSRGLMSIVYSPDSSAALKPLLYYQPPLNGDRISVGAVGGSRKTSGASISSAPSTNKLEKPSAHGFYAPSVAHGSPYLPGTSAVPAPMYPPDTFSRAAGGAFRSLPGSDAASLPSQSSSSLGTQQSVYSGRKPSEERTFYLTSGGNYYPYFETLSAAPYRLPTATTGTAALSGFLWSEQQPQQPVPQTETTKAEPGTRVIPRKASLNGKAGTSQSAQPLSTRSLRLWKELEELKEQYRHVQDNFRRENEDLKTENFRLQRTLGDIQSRVNCILDELRDIKARGDAAEGGSLTEAHKELAEKCTTMLGQLLTGQLPEEIPAQPIGPLSLLSSFTEEQLQQLLDMEKPVAGSAAPAAPALAARLGTRLPAADVSKLPSHQQTRVGQSFLPAKTAGATGTGEANIGTRAKTPTTRATPPPTAAPAVGGHPQRLSSAAKTSPAGETGLAANLTPAPKAALLAAKEAPAAAPAVGALPTGKPAAAVADATSGGGAALPTATRAPAVKPLGTGTDTKDRDTQETQMLISAGGPKDKDLAEQARRTAALSQAGGMLYVQDTGYIQVPIRTATAVDKPKMPIATEDKKHEDERKGSVVGKADNVHVAPREIKQIPAGKAAKTPAGTISGATPLSKEKAAEMKSVPAKDRARNKDAVVPQKVGSATLDRDIVEGNVVIPKTSDAGAADQLKKLDEEDIQRMRSSTGSFSGLFSLFFGAGSTTEGKSGSEEISEATTATTEPKISTEAAASLPSPGVTANKDSVLVSHPIDSKDVTSASETPIIRATSAEEAQRKETLSSKTMTQFTTAKKLPTAVVGAKKPPGSTFAVVPVVPKMGLKKELATAPADKEHSASLVEAGGKEEVAPVPAVEKKSEVETKSLSPEKKKSAMATTSLPIGRTGSAERTGKSASKAGAPQTVGIPTFKEAEQVPPVVSKQIQSRRSKEELGEEHRAVLPRSEAGTADITAAVSQKIAIPAAAQTPAAPLNKVASLTRLPSKSASTPTKAPTTPARTVEAKPLSVKADEKAASSTAAEAVKVPGVAAKSGGAPAGKVEAKSPTATAESRSPSLSRTEERPAPSAAAVAGEAKTGAAEIPGLAKVPGVTAKSVATPSAKVETESPVAKADEKAAPSGESNAAEIKSVVAKTLGLMKVPGIAADSVAAPKVPGPVPKLTGSVANTEATLPAPSEARGKVTHSVAAPDAKTGAPAETANGPVVPKTLVAAGASGASALAKSPAITAGDTKGSVPGAAAPYARGKSVAGEAGKVASLVAKRLPGAPLKHPSGTDVSLKTAQIGVEDTYHLRVTGKVPNAIGGSQPSAADEAEINVPGNHTAPFRAASSKGQRVEAPVKRGPSAEQILRARVAKGEAHEQTPEEGVNRVPTSVNADRFDAGTPSGSDAAANRTVGTGFNKEVKDVLRSGSSSARKGSKDMDLANKSHPTEAGNAAADLKKINGPSFIRKDSAAKKQFSARTQGSDEAGRESEEKASSAEKEELQGGSLAKPGKQVMRTSSGNDASMTQIRGAARESAPGYEKLEGRESEKQAKNILGKVEQKQIGGLPERGDSGTKAEKGARKASENAAMEKQKSTDEEGRQVRALSSGFSGFFYNLFGQPSEAEDAEAGTN